MKTVFFITSMAAVFILAQNNTMGHFKKQTTLSPAKLDSLLEMQRVERMRNKLCRP
jgi:hypothetical protein